MSKIIKPQIYALFQSPKQRLKHLIGQHNQLDHAWNRGTGGGAEIDGNTYQGAIKLLDEQVANGEITQETADLTRQNLLKKFNERYDLLSTLSLGMAHTTRRNRTLNKLEKIRGNQLTDSAGIASAARQGMANDIQQAAVQESLSNKKFEQQIEEIKKGIDEIKNLAVQFNQETNKKQQEKNEYVTVKQKLDDLVKEEDDLRDKLREHQRNYAPFGDIQAQELHYQKEMEFRKKINDVQNEYNQLFDSLKSNRFWIQDERKKITEKRIEAERQLSIAERYGSETQQDTAAEYLKYMRLEEDEFNKNNPRNDKWYENNLESELRTKMENLRNSINQIHITVPEDIVGDPTEIIKEIKKSLQSYKSSIKNDEIDILDKISYASFINGMPDTYIDAMSKYLERHVTFSAAANTIANAIEKIRQDAFKNNVDYENPPENFTQINKEINEIQQKQSIYADEYDQLMESTLELEIKRYESMGLTDRDFFDDLNKTGISADQYIKSYENKQSSKLRPYGDDVYSKQLKEKLDRMVEIRKTLRPMQDRVLELIDERSKIKKNAKEQTYQNMIRLYTNIFEALSTGNPKQIDFTGKKFSIPEFSTEEREKLIRAVLSMIPSDTGSALEVKVDDYIFSGERASAGYDSRNGIGVLHTGNESPPSTIVHEALHLIETQYYDMCRFFNIWAEQRIKDSNEVVRPLNQIHNTTSYGADEKSVIDSVDSPYTLKVYEDGFYHEVLTTAFDKLFLNTFASKDPEHLRVALHGLLRFLPNGSIRSKSKSINDIKIRINRLINKQN